jgi:GNAT superfamily N-acetyltransferase
LSFDFREATEADAPVIAAIHGANWLVNYVGALAEDLTPEALLVDRNNVWRRRLSSPPANQHVLLAEDAGTVVGFACAHGAKDARWGTFLDNIHVAGDNKSRGIGLELVRRVACWSAKNHPGCGLHLWVLEQNVRAQRFYQRLGAEDSGEGEVWGPPAGNNAPSRLYTWTPEQVESLASAAGARVA